MNKFTKSFFLWAAASLALTPPFACFAQQTHSHHKKLAYHQPKTRYKTTIKKSVVKASTVETTPSQPMDLQSGLDAILKKISPRAHVGVMVESIDGSRVLYQHNADNLFTPASVNKLFVAIAALDYLKPEYRFETRLRATGQINNGVLDGDLYVQFNGDPTLTDRQLVSLLNELKTMNVSQINGHVYLDNTAYGSSAYAPGWVLHDLIFGYAAPLNAVILNENRFAIILSPSSQNGQMVSVSTTVPPGVIKIENNATTGARKNCPLSVYSDNDNIYHVNGCISRQPSKQYFALALRDPVTYAKVLIGNTLRNSQINFNGSVEIQQAPSNSVVLTLHQSAPLNSIIKEMLKESDNLFTNSILKQIGGVYYQTQGTWQNGLNAMKQILGNPAKVDFNQIHLFDGSGLSRYNLVSPRQLANLLHYAYAKKTIEPDLWDALPIAGQDGTMRGRLGDVAKGELIHAKTGTMKNAGVSALAGYMKTHNNGMVIFVIMTNGLEDTHRTYKNMEDRICKFLLTAR